MSGEPRLRTLGRYARISLGVGLGLAAADTACLLLLPPEHGRLILFASVVVASAALGVSLMLRTGIRTSTLLVFLGAAALFSLYLSSTGYDERNYDAQAHLQYIHRLVDNHELPLAKDCTICHHPPLYHLLAAGVMVAAYRSAAVSAPFALQILSLALFFTFLAFGTLTVQQLSSDDRSQPWAAAFLALWPVSVINSVRVNNDLLLFALAAAALYYIVRWRRESSRTHLIVACVLASAATLTKLNGLVLTGAIAGLLVWDVARGGSHRRRAWSDAPALGALLLVVAAHAGVRLWREPGELSRRALGAAAVEDDRPVSRSPLQYLRFDPVHYYQEPYSVARQIPGEDVPYWNHVLKSSLFGTRNQFQWGDGPTFKSSRTLGRVEGGILLLLIAYLVFAAAYLRRIPRDHRALAVYLAAWFLAAGLAFHAWAPKPHHTDFRFIYPVLVPIVALFLEAVRAVGRRLPIGGKVGYGLLVAFWAVSVAFFVTGVRPSAERIAERIKPGLEAEAARPNSLIRFRFNRPKPSATSR